MPFLGKTPTVGNFILLDAITVSNTATFALTKDTLDYYPGSAQNMIVSVNGVTQAPLTAYTITDNNIIFSSALDSDVDVIDYILVLGDTLNIGRPSDSTVGATQLQDYAVTSVKMSNTGVSAATYGTSTSIPQITIDAAGRITAATGIDRSNQFEDLTVTGNLTVSGNTVTVDAQTLSVEDPLIHLAANNETSDVVDIGFVGHYSNDGGTTKLHTGFFRDASDEQYYLFNGFEDDNLDLSSPSTTIDRTANTFALADLNIAGLTITSETDIDTGIRIKQFVANNVADGDYYLFSDASRDADLRLYDFTNSTDILYFDKGTTHIGMGTNAPSAKLDIRQEKTGGGVLLQVYNEDNSDTTTQVAGIALGPDTRGGTARITAVKENADFSTNAGRDVALTFSSVLNNTPTEYVRITSAGNVGVGTNDPQAILDVRANTNSTIRIANDGDGIATLYLRNTGTSDGSISQEAGDMFFQIAGDKKIELRNDGNFGIGRLNPDARLTVDTDQQLIARLASSNVGITGVRLEGIDTSATDNVYVDWFYDAENRQYGFGEGTASGSLPINSGIDHADVVIKDGNVRIPSGVGLSSLSITTNPLTLGDLTSYNMAFDANEIQTRNNGAAETLIINKAGGNVGIGWNNPQVQLDLYQVTGDDLRISASSSDYWGINAGNYFTISDSGTLRLRIYDNGKIVLGDDIVPETLLHLADQSTDAYLQSATGLYSYTPKGGDLLQIQNRSSGTDDLYAGIWFETGNPATNTTGTNRSARFAYVVQNDTAYTGNFVWQLRHSDASLKEMMRLNHKGHLKVPAKVHFGMTEANIDNDDNPGARLKIEHDQGTPDDAPVVYIHRQNNLSTPLKSYAALFIKDHQSNYPIAVRDATDDSHIFSILGDGQAEFYPKDTVANANKNCMFIDVNMSGSDVLTVDRTHRGLFIDVDSTATGGDTSNEHRIHGISADVRCTGDSDLIYGSYNYAESQHGSGIITQVVGTLGYAVADDTGSGRTTNVYGVQALAYAYNTGTGGDSNLYGTWSKALLTTSCDKDTATATGVYGEVELDNPGQAQTLNAAYAFQAQIDNDSAGNVSVTNSYLYYGNYQGTLPNGNVYGVYILDNVTNYFQGSLDVAGTKNFQIKHPVQSLANTHNLVHTVIEGPSADNMYNGMVRLVDGSATINIDTEFGMTQGTFVALNRNNRRSVTNEEGFTAVKCSLTGNILTITAESNTCTDEVFWMVIGQRQDEEIKASNKTDDDGYLILEPEQVEHVRPEKHRPNDDRYE